MACSSKQRPQIYVGDTTPRKTEIYQIQEGDNTIGYAEKYEWETKKGEARHHYFLYNLEGIMVGYVRGDGMTEEYLPGGNRERLGNFTLEGAAERIFDASEAVHIFTARLKDVPVKSKVVVIKKSGKRSRAAKPAAKKPQIEDVEEVPVEEESSKGVKKIKEKQPDFGDQEFGW